MVIGLTRNYTLVRVHGFCFFQLFLMVGKGAHGISLHLLFVVHACKSLMLAVGILMSMIGDVCSENLRLICVSGCGRMYN